MPATPPVRVLRGRKPTIDADRAASERLLEVAAEGQQAVRVWTPHKQVVFGRRDARREGYERAREAADGRGFPPVERSVGGRVVAYDGAQVLAFARTEPVADFRRGTDERYERLTADVESALTDLGVEPVRGEPDDSFCPGAHSLSLEVGGSLRKVVGIAQRVTSDAALVSGILLVEATDELRGVLEAVYAALEVPFDPKSVGDVADATAVSSERVRRVLESALVGEREHVLEDLEDLEA
ncbi:lipoate--protein ligase family protein [Natronosalvus rutilus]|uniref:Lipoate--protein ligase family protein n=1 Tax=Natronosalvus rutilus TaxID=2953753 RepID=A0A9E7SYH5_9EURY|nr:lipoate--protein ligase family protein [Natronosalvus rutilus]UTF55078.1 lipoate--protein ligase family protein [Natronosalvus rutilus]